MSEEVESSEEYESSEQDTQNDRGRIFVYIRIRPFLPSEKGVDDGTPFKLIDTKNNKLTCKIFF